MTTVVTEQFEIPVTARQRRAVRAQRAYNADRLAGRMVWDLPGLAFRSARATAGPQRDVTRLAAAPRELARTLTGAPLSDRVRPGDLLVVHDGPGATASSAAREVGGEVLWQLPMLVGYPAAVTALALAQSVGARPDAYVVCWRERGPRGTVGVETIAALVPAGDAVAAVRLPAPDAELRSLGWQSILAVCAHLAEADRVGGVLHPKPVVAAH